MQAPPGGGSPYDYASANDPYPGVTGVLTAWDFALAFWGGVINQAWDDLQDIINV